MGFAEGARTARMRGLCAVFALLSIHACGPATPIVNRAAQVLAATAVSSGMGPAKRTPTPDAEPGAAGIKPDGSSVDAIVAGLYASVSHGPEYEPNWDRLRNLFLPGAMVVPPKPRDAERVTVLTVDEFVERVRRYIAGRRQKGEPLGFTERETSRRADCFGRMCQVFSTYEILRAPRDPAPFTRGIHSLQLLDDGRRWWIAAMVWDTEPPDNPIPAGAAPVESPSRQGVDP
jgi:hypothetical protein